MRSSTGTSGRRTGSASGRARSRRVSSTCGTTRLVVRLLAEITHDEAILVRVERIEALPADGSHDDGLPGFAFLADPDVTMASFFDRLYGHDHELNTAEWDEILTAILSGRRRRSPPCS